MQGEKSQYKPHFLTEVITDPQVYRGSPFFFFSTHCKSSQLPIFLHGLHCNWQNTFVYIFHLFSKYLMYQAGEVRGEQPKASVLKGLQVNVDLILSPLLDLKSQEGRGLVVLSTFSV